jgi:hypothetical protein
LVLRQPIRPSIEGAQSSATRQRRPVTTMITNPKRRPLRARSPRSRPPESLGRRGLPTREQNHGASPELGRSARLRNVASEVRLVAFRLAWYEIPYRDKVCQLPGDLPVFEIGQLPQGPGNLATRYARLRMGAMCQGAHCRSRRLCEKFLELRCSGVDRGRVGRINTSEETSPNLEVFRRDRRAQWRNWPAGYRRRDVGRQLERFGDAGVVRGSASGVAVRTGPRL